MSEERTMRLGQVARKLNIGKDTIIEHLAKKGFEIDHSPNAKISLSGNKPRMKPLWMNLQ